MIGSTMDRMVTAEKMSVQQLQESIQNGVLPAYIGIPILKDKMQSQQAPQQQPQQPPIAQQVMQQAAGLDGLPSNLPVADEAEGVVALASGGYLDEFLEDDVNEQDVEDREYNTALNSLYSSMGDMKNMSYPDKAMMPALNTTPDVEAPMRQAAKQTAPADGIGGLLQSSADKYNLPTALLSNIAQAESGGKANAQNPRSSAGGVFQFIDDTWKQLGGTPEGKGNPEENIDLGAKYTRQNSEYLKDQLGRNPSYAEVYAAHHFGPGVVKMLKNANPQEPVESGLAQFNSPAAVERIIQQNPYLKGKTVGDLLASLETKAGEGIVALAGGGQVARYAEAGAVNLEDPMTPFMPAQTPEVTGPFGDMSQYGLDPYGQELSYEELGESAKPRSFREMFLPESMKQSPLYIPEPEKKAAPVATTDLTKTAPTKTAPATTTTVDKTAPVLEDKKTEDISKQMVADQKKEPEKSFAEIFKERMVKADSEAEKQRTMDAYMALTTAGLAIMGGSSSNAYENIGQGALAGMAQYGGSQKARAAEQLARDKNLLTAERNQQLTEAAKLTAGISGERLTDAEKTRAATRVQSMIKAYIESTPSLMMNENKFNLATQQLMSNPAFKQDYELIYGSTPKPNPYAGYSAKPIK